MQVVSGYITKSRTPDAPPGQCRKIGHHHSEHCLYVQTLRLAVSYALLKLYLCIGVLNNTYTYYMCHAPHLQMS